jgi:hypothetical protein
MAIIRDKRKAFKEYATKERLDATLRLALEYGNDYSKLNVEDMIEDFLGMTVNHMCLIHYSTKELFDKFVSMYSGKYMYQRFLKY